MWWRKSVEAGPEERRSGWSGWKVRDVMEDLIIKWETLVEHLRPVG